MTSAPRWARVSGVAGLVANVVLILFFALARPWTTGGGAAWLGPVNDVALVVQFAALVPVALTVHARLHLGRTVTATAVAAMVVVVLLQLALLTGLLAFEVQVWAVTAGIAVTFGWVLVSSRAGRAALPRPVVRFGTTVGGGFLAGGAVVALGLLLPSGSVAQYAVCGLGGLVGLVGWLGFPVWPLVLARTVFEEER
jgi:hypothetical protein